MGKASSRLNNMRPFHFIFAFLIFYTTAAFAQSVLSSRVSLAVKGQRLGDVLSLMEEKGNFRFSYNSNILPIDSLVSIKADHLTVEDLLDDLLKNRFEFRQAGKFVIIRYAPNDLVIRINESIGSPDLYTVVGQIVDKRTEKPIQNASIYERNLLVAELSDANGLFTMKLKHVTKPITLTVSKENYKSAVTHFLAEVVISGKADTVQERYIASNLDTIERTLLGKMLITTKQKIQSINIGGFISNAPVQFSLLPSLNSHGAMSGQIVNKFSFNAIGAYSAGVDGGEIGLVFNINKSNVRYFQFAGAFNLVGGDVRGTQIAGFFNYDLGNFRGAQLALGYNRVAKSFEGVQITGIHNYVSDSFNGMQIALGLNVTTGNFRGVQLGALNLIPKKLNGFQIGVLGNTVLEKVQGMQIAGAVNLSKETDGMSLAALANVTLGDASGGQIGVLNYARRLKGFQIGVVNSSVENEGFSFGLLNISLKGYHKFALTSNEITALNFSYKGGNRKFYNILTAGMATKSTAKLYTAGWGFGTEIRPHTKLNVNPEFTAHYVYQGNLDDVNLLGKFELPIGFKINKWLAIQAGPSVNVLYSDQTKRVEKFTFLQDRKHQFNMNNSKLTGWFGWNFGLVFW